MAGPNYEIPPWLHPSAAQGYGQLYAEGLRMRNASQMQAADLAQRSAEANMRLQAQQQAAEQDRLREDQQLQMKKAYEDAQIGLQKQELDLSQQQADQKIKEAATAFQVNQKYAQLVASGVPEDKALLMVGDQASDFAKRVHDMRPPTAPTVQTANVNGQDVPYLMDSKTGTPHFFPKASVPSSISAQDREQLRDLRKKRDSLSVVLNDPGKINIIAQIPDGAKKITDMESQLKTIERNISKITGASTSTGTSGDMPFKEGQKVRNKQTGKVYVILNGKPVPIEDAPAQE